MQLAELAKKLQAEIVATDVAKAGQIDIAQVAPLQAAKAGQVSFLSNPEYEKYLADTKASAVIVGKASDTCKVPQLVHKNPYLAFAKAAQIFNPPRKMETGISPLAKVSDDAKLGKNVAIMPFVFVGKRCVIGDNVTIYPGTFVGDDCVIGNDTEIRANVVLEYGTKIGARVLIHAGAVLGGDGFGFAPGDGDIVKIPQIGNVVIEDDVELGATTSIDRAALGETRIGASTKLDSNVHVGHNVRIGHHTMISGMAGIAGSAQIGNWVLMGGHSGVSGHVKVGDKVKIGAMTGITKDTPGEDTYMGFPAEPAGVWRRTVVHLRRLGDYEKRIKELEKKLEKLSSIP